MRYVSGQDRDQTALFPLSLEELVPADHPCRVIEAFVGMLDLAELGFTHARLGRTGRPPHDPADLLKLYLYGYLDQVRSSRRLERECQRNVELIWLLGRLAPDHKTIANFRRHNGVALQRPGAGLVRFCQQAGLVKGQWVAIDGSRFQAVASGKAVVRAADVEPRLARLEERIAHYLAQLDAADSQESDSPIDRSKVQDALELLRQRREALIETGRKLAAHVPANRSVNNQADGTLLPHTVFTYDPQADVMRCPQGKTLTRKQLMRKGGAVVYQAREQDLPALPAQTRVHEEEAAIGPASSA